MHTEDQIREQESKEPCFGGIGAAGFGASLLVIGFLGMTYTLPSEDPTGWQMLAFFLGIGWVIMCAICSTQSISSKMKHENRMRGLANKQKAYQAYCAEREFEKSEEKRKKKVLQRARETVWKAIDPEVKEDDRPSPEEVRIAEAFIYSETSK